MGATQSVATIRVFCIRNDKHAVHYWNYPNVPEGWHWESTGVNNDFEIISPTVREQLTLEELFVGIPGNIDKMRQYLTELYQYLEDSGIIEEFYMTDRVVIGQSFWERLLSILKRDN